MLEDQIIKHTFIALLIVVGSAALGRLMKTLVDVLFRRFIDKGKTTLYNRILQVVESRVVALSILGGCSLGIREMRKGLTAENVTHHQVLDYLAVTLFIVIIVIVFHVLGRIFNATIEWYTDKVSLKNRSDITPTIVPFTTKLVNILLFFIVGMIILDHLGVNIGGLLVSLGVGSLAIALAAQETIANMIAWFVILVDQPIRIGDRIRLPSGEEGEVHQIGLRSTRIVNPDNNLVIVPNGELVKNRIVNLSMPDLSSNVVVDVNVVYGTDVSKVRGLMIGVVIGRADIQKLPEPKVVVSNLGEAGIQLKLIARTPDVTRKPGIEAELRELICRVFSDAGIEIPSVARLIQAKGSREA
ncbi:MAG: mechanosensitive ion channel family protein [Ignavibacteria bacterium]|nr:mechanosensitive ion channel family protein [Ignavibacteria bacterium]MBI3765414.1 mechanosensitive ion channel family protein [Ignavibacteriales bacterium]